MRKLFWCFVLIITAILKVWNVLQTGLVYSSENTCNRLSIPGGCLQLQPWIRSVLVERISPIRRNNIEKLLIEKDHQLRLRSNADEFHRKQDWCMGFREFLKNCKKVSHVTYWLNYWHSCRDSGNNFHFPDIASHTGCFHIYFGHFHTLLFVVVRFGSSSNVNVCHCLFYSIKF